jgi:hypothetical protein
LASLAPDKLRNYAALMAALDIQFGVAHQVELIHVKLKERVRKQDLLELAEDIERLA